MKYSSITLLFAGVISTTEAHRLNPIQNHGADGIENYHQDASLAETEEDFEEENVQLNAPCVYLDETKAELEYQVDMFSRTFNPAYWTNALNISSAIGHKDLLHVHSYELYDNAFSYPRVRKYEFVNENMDVLEHFQDNLNTNISNKNLMDKFIAAATQV